MDYLAEIGVQRWRRRGVVKADATVEGSVSIAQDQQANSVPADSPPDPAVVDTLARNAEQPNSDLSWADLIAKMESGECPGCKNSHPILGDGDINAQWVFLVDAPNARDIAAQKLVSGRTGQLLDAILGALGLAREDIYLSSVFKCAPHTELSLSAQCGDILPHQLHLIKPKYIVTLGEFVAQTITKSNESLEVLRSSELRHRGSNGTIIATHELSQLLDTPLLKREVWADLKKYLPAVKRGNNK